MPNGRTLEQAEKQIAALVEENKRLATELEGLQTAASALEKSTKDALAAKTAAEKSVATAATRLEAANRQVAELKSANSVLTAQTSRLNRQVEKAPLNPLTVDEATVLFDGVLKAFRGSPTLEVRNVSLNLKLASAKIGDVPVLLVPEPTSVDPALLHELRLDLTTRATEVATTIRQPAVPPVGPTRGVAVDKAARPAKTAKKRASKPK